MQPNTIAFLEARSPPCVILTVIGKSAFKADITHDSANTIARIGGKPLSGAKPYQSCEPPPHKQHQHRTTARSPHQPTAPRRIRGALDDLNRDQIQAKDIGDDLPPEGAVGAAA